MRIESNLLVVSPEFGAGGIGGHTRRIVNFLLDEGFKVQIHANKGALAKNAPHPNLKIDEIAEPFLGFSLFNPFFDLLSSLRLRSQPEPKLIIRTLPPFYPHIPKISNTAIPELTISHAVLPAFETLRKYGKMGVEDKLTLSPVGKFLTASEKKMLQNADCAIAVSEYTKRMIIDYYNIDESKIEVVPNFVDTTVFFKRDSFTNPELARKLLEFKGNSRLAVFVAQLPVGGAKNFELLFDVMAASKKINVKFVVVGMGPDHLYARSYARRLEQDRVLFLGYVNNSVLPEIYSLCDFLLITSLYENLPTVLLEAMACGSIPISTDVGGLSEALENKLNGLLVPPEKDSFLNALSELCACNQQTLNTISERNILKVDQKFNLKNASARYVNIIAGMIEK
ncbi:MAG: glycosyltransferase family 4 protein [Candidatus Bathyarchaeota archaeon]|nr:glycosyltransferase family 4 protein [Candidatus Bathyarchaeota archaeon]